MTAEAKGDIKFSASYTQEQVLAIETCPGFNVVFNRATEKPLNLTLIDGCSERGCRLKVKVAPMLSDIYISGECIKE